MPSLRPAGRFFASVEPLEARIAPARIIITGVPNNRPGGNDVDYVDSNPDDALFVNTGSATDAISLAVGGTADTHYLKLFAGDVLQVYTDSAFVDYLKVKSGNVIAFFVDKNGDNEVAPGELVSLSLGKNASVVLRGNLDGDVVTNLNEHNTKSTADDTLEMAVGGASGLVSPLQGIVGLTIGGGSLGGKILAGGNVANVIVNGTVSSILAGTAANGASFDFFPGVSGGDGVISVPDASPLTGKAGASISNVIVDGIGDRIEAGAGGVGGAGGSLRSIQVANDSNGFSLLAGAGGDGTSRGGVGGLISKVYIAGVADSSFNSSIIISGGHGGNTPAGSGGAGGAVSDVFVGFEVISGKAFESVNLLADKVLLSAGDGGDGKNGAAGGAVARINLRVVTSDGEGDEISIKSGTGGGALLATGGKTGAGGAISGLLLRNQGIATQTADIFVRAGSGGSAVGSASGSAGGSISDVTLLGNDLQVLAGNGSTAKTGGAGGSLTGIVVQQQLGVISHNGLFNAGTGGDGTAGKGGAGGRLKTLTVQDGNFAVLSINGGTAANGGMSTVGAGGAGGLVSGLDILDGGKGGEYEGTLSVRTGDGGKGSRGGGAGGALTTATLLAQDLNISINLGDGGAVLPGGSGNGGLGGAISSLAVSAEGATDNSAVTAVVSAGVGGDGVGAGGAGGNVKLVNISAIGVTSLHAGDGGNAGSGAAGKGGSLLDSIIFAESASGSLVAGNAGTSGAKPGAGGSISGSSAGQLSGVYAYDEVTIRAGNGSNGGAGGQIKFVGYGSTIAGFAPAPVGDIIVAAGHGSGKGSFAGAGGSINGVNGTVSLGNGALTQITAGNGGSTELKSAAGGSVSNVSIDGGGASFFPGILTIEAGTGGSGGKTGAKGGDVKLVSVSAIDGLEDDDVGTILRSIAAGDGGTGSSKGGLGGTIDGVRVPDHDIGVRNGEDFGYTTMGGLFAGAGGGGSTPGLAGKVRNISANSIAAIVAGKADIPQEVTLVELITVNGFQLLKDGNIDVNDIPTFQPAPSSDTPRTFTFDPDYYAGANLVGAIADITLANGGTFHFINRTGTEAFELGDQPIDGLILTKKLDQATLNFTPEARLVAGVFYDYNNR